MKRFLQLAFLLATLLLSSGLAQAAEVPSAAVQLDPGANAAAMETRSESTQTSAKIETVAAQEASSPFLVEPLWMTLGDEKHALGAASSYPGYCYIDCRSCYPIGPMNPGCTSPDYPGINFPCTAEPLC